MHILVFEHDIKKYPPILSVIEFLIKNNKQFIFIGCCYDDNYLEYIKKSGGTFYNVINNDTASSKLIKLTRLFSFKNKVASIIDSIEDSTIERIWLFGETAVWLLYKLVFRYKCIAYLFEMPHLTVTPKYKLLSPGISYQKVLQSTYRVICCEHNRALITKSYFELEVLPLVIPNKPVILDTDIHSFEVPDTLKDKKVILYQGIFNYPERKMDDLCDAVDLLDDEFVVALMGSDNAYKDSLKKKYSKSRKIIFLPYTAAPNHLAITRYARIGFLSYYGEANNIRNTLNTLFCAPNKIFEYSKFGIPMVSNEVPALTYLFEKYNCGVTSKSNKEDLCAKILKIDSDYNNYSLGSKAFYESVDLDQLYIELI